MKSVTRRKHLQKTQLRRYIEYIKIVLIKHPSSVLTALLTQDVWGFPRQAVLQVPVTLASRPGRAQLDAEGPRLAQSLSDLSSDASYTS